MDEINSPFDLGNVIKVDGKCYRRDSVVQEPPDSFLLDLMYATSPCTDCEGGSGSAESGGFIGPATPACVYTECPPEIFIGSSDVSSAAPPEEDICTAGVKDAIDFATPFLYSKEGSRDVRIWDAIQKLTIGPQTAVISYSIVPDDVILGLWGEKTREFSQDSIPVGEEPAPLPVSAMSAASVQAEITYCLSLWKSMFESIFSPSNGYPNQLTIDFLPEGVELGSPPPLLSPLVFPTKGVVENGYTIPSGFYPLTGIYDQVGMIRLALSRGCFSDGAIDPETCDLFRAIPGNSPLSSEYFFNESVLLIPNGNSLRDIVLSKEVPFRDESTTASYQYSPALKKFLYSPTQSLRFTLMRALAVVFGLPSWNPRDVFTGADLKAIRPEHSRVIDSAESLPPGNTWAQLVPSLMSVSASPGPLYTNSFDSDPAPGGRVHPYITSSFPNGWLNNQIDRCLISWIYEDSP